MTRLVNDEKTRHWVLTRAYEVFMQGEQTRDVVTHPILPTANFPQKISASRQRAKLEGQLPEIKPDIFAGVLQLQQAGIIGDFRGYFVDCSVQAVALRAWVEGLA